MVDRAGSTQINTFGVQGQTLDIVVENQGRFNYGADINDNKKVWDVDLRCSGDDDYCRQLTITSLCQQRQQQ